MVGLRAEQLPVNDNMDQAEVERLRGQSKVDTCDCCESESVIVKAYRVEDGPFSLDKQQWTIRWYCDLCASTMASEWMRYNEHDGYLLSGMAYMINTLLKEIRAVQKS